MKSWPPTQASDLLSRAPQIQLLWRSRPRKAWVCPSWVASLALGSYRHISMSARAMSAHESRTPTEPWEWEGEGSEPICLPFIDVQGQDQ